MAIYIFRKLNCPLQVFEAGLGGRFDATKMARAENVVLTTIEKEHTDILGTSRQEILQEKLGILSAESKNLFYTDLADISAREIEKEARRIAPQLTPIYWNSKKNGPTDKIIGNEMTENEITGSKMTRSKIAGSQMAGKLMGNYLEYNRRYARFALSQLGFPLQRERGPSPPGRLERHLLKKSNGKLLELIFDVAHNRPAIEISLGELGCHLSGQQRDATLILFALLPRRQAQPLLAAIKEAGFQHIRQLSGGVFAAAENAAMNAAMNETGTDYSLWNHKGLLKVIEADFRAERFARLIAIGSHYLYDYFLEVKLLLQKALKASEIAMENEDRHK